MPNDSSQPARSRTRGKAIDAQAAFADLLAESSRRGFYGSVSLTLSVQDGFIQQVRVATDRLIR